MAYFVFMLHDIEILQPINIKLLSKLHFFPKGSVFPQILSFAYHLHNFFFIYPMPSILLVMERELIFKNLNSL